MTVYHVYANAAEGLYEAEDEQGARDAFARDAGYQSEEDMGRQLEQPSEIVATRLFGRIDVPALREVASRVADRILAARRRPA